MEYLSSYLSKQIISIYEASMIGTVISATFDKKMRRICALLVVSDNDEEEVIYNVPIGRIVTADNALTIKNKNAVKKYIDSELFVKSPINLPVFTTSGEKKGIIKDIEFDGQTFQVSNLVLEDSLMPANEVASISNTLVIIKGDGFTRLQAPRVRKRRTTSRNISDVKMDQNNPVPEKIGNGHLNYNDDQIYDDMEENEYREEMLNPITSKPKPPYNGAYNAPARIISDYSFLLDRKVLADVYNTTGELIIPANSRITTEIVDIARRYGKLVELTVGSRL